MTWAEFCAAGIRGAAMIFGGANSEEAMSAGQRARELGLLYFPTLGYANEITGRDGHRHRRTAHRPGAGTPPLPADGQPRKPRHARAAGPRHRRRIADRPACRRTDAARPRAEDCPGRRHCGRAGQRSGPIPGPSGKGHSGRGIRPFARFSRQGQRKRAADGAQAGSGAPPSVGRVFAFDKDPKRLARLEANAARAGAGGCIGDIGTHAYNLADFITGIPVLEVSAELTTFVAGRRLDDNTQVLMRYANGAPMSIDLTTMLQIENNFEIGGMYRTDKAYAAMSTIRLSKRFVFGYAYEMSMQPTLAAARNTNEILLKFQF